MGETKLLMDAQEVAQMLGVTVDTIYSFVSQRKMPFYKIGRLTKFVKEDIERWIQERKVNTLDFNQCSKVS